MQKQRYYKRIDNGKRMVEASREEGSCFDGDVALIPEGVTSVEVEGIFRDCVEIVIPDSVEFVSPLQFNEVKHVRKITMPVNVRQFRGKYQGRAGRGNLQFGLFSNCPELEEVELTGKFTPFPRNYLKTDRKESHVLEEFSIWYSFWKSPKFTSLIALEAKLTDFWPDQQGYALRGFCKAKLRGAKMAWEYEESYLNYLQENIHIIVGHKDPQDYYIYRYMMLEGLLDPALTNQLLEIFDDMEIRMQLLEYNSQKSSENPGEEEFYLPEL